MDEKYYSLHQLILSSANLHCYFHIVFMYHALHFPTFIFTLYVPCFPFFLIDPNQEQVLLIKWAILFWSSKILFCFFQLFENGYIHNVVSTLFSTMNLDTENNNIVSTLANVVNINVHMDKVVSTLIWLVRLRNEISP